MSKTLSILAIAAVVASLPVVIGLSKQPSASSVAQTVSGSVPVSNFRIAPPLTVISGGIWSASKGVYSITSPKSLAGGNGNIAIHSASVPDQFGLDTDANVVSTPAKNSFAILFAYKDSSNYYYAKFSESGSLGGLFKVTGGLANRISDLATEISAGANYKIKILRTAQSLKVYLNDTLVANTTVSGDLAGKVGYATESDAAFFDNLKVIGY